MKTKSSFSFFCSSKMQRRQVYTSTVVARMQKESQRKEYQHESNVKMVARDKLMALTSAAEERVENKRCH